MLRPLPVRCPVRKCLQRPGQNDGAHTGTQGGHEREGCDVRREKLLGLLVGQVWRAKEVGVAKEDPGSGPNTSVDL